MMALEFIPVVHLIIIVLDPVNISIALHMLIAESLVVSFAPLPVIRIGNWILFLLELRCAHTTQSQYGV